MAYKFKYKLTHKANKDLDDIVKYISVDLSNLKAASEFIDRLEKGIDDIRSFPQSCQLVENEFLLGMKIRKKLIGNYVMYYQVDEHDEIILILRVIYGRRNLDEILRKLNNWVLCAKYNEIMLQDILARF